MAYYDDYAEPPPPPPDGYFGAPEEPAEPVPMFDARGRPVAPERASEIYRLRMSTAAMAERVSDARTALDRARTEAEEGVGARALDATGGGTMAIPSVDWDSLPITEGAVMMKGQGGFFSGRGWRDRYMHLERGPSLIIADNERMTNILREVPLTPNTSVALGDDSIAHRNSRVKFTFTIFPADESEPVELNVEDEGVRAVWVQAINEIIATEAEAQRVRHAMAERGDMGYGASGEGGDEFAGIGEPIDSGEDERRAAEEEAAQYFAYGQGVSEALRGEEAEFTVEMRDDTGLANPMGSDPSALSVILESEHLRLDLTPESLGDGSFLCTYTPAREGEYELSIKVRGQHINDSPFAVAVGAAPTAPSHCLVTGDGAARAVVGTISSFRILARNQFDEPCTTGGDEWIIEVHGPGRAHEIYDLGNGTYDVTYEVDLQHPDIAEPAAAGNLMLVPQLVVEVGLVDPKYRHLSLDDTRPYKRPLAGSPFHPVICLDASGPPPRDWKHGLTAGQLEALAEAQRKGTLEDTLLAEGMLSLSLSERLGRSAAAGARAGVGFGESKGAEDDDRVWGSGRGGSGGGSGGGGGGGSSGGIGPISGVSPDRIHEMMRHAAEEAARRVREELAAESAARERELETERESLRRQREELEAKYQELQALSRQVQADGAGLAELARRIQEKSGASPGAAAATAAAMLAAEPPVAVAAPSSRAGPAAPHSAAGRDPAAAPSVVSGRTGTASVSLESLGGGRRGPHGAAASYAGRPAAAATGVSEGRAATVTGPSRPSRRAAPAPAAAVAGEGGPSPGAPDELFDPEVIALFAQHRAALRALFQHYAPSDEGPAGGLGRMRFSQFRRMMKDYDIVPTFARSEEIQQAFLAAAASSGTGPAAPPAKEDAEGVKEALRDAVLEYPSGFIEAIGRTALVALSRPTFEPLYRTPVKKVEVILLMWSLANPGKLEEIKRAPRRKSPKAKKTKKASRRRDEVDA